MSSPSCESILVTNSLISLNLYLLHALVFDKEYLDLSQPYGSLWKWYLRWLCYINHMDVLHCGFLCLLTFIPLTTNDGFSSMCQMWLLVPAFRELKTDWETDKRTECRKRGENRQSRRWQVEETKVTFWTPWSPLFCMTQKNGLNGWKFLGLRAIWEVIHTNVILSLWLIPMSVPSMLCVSGIMNFGLW